MRLGNEFEPIRQWAQVRGIYTHGNTRAQYDKLLEELSELDEGLYLGSDVETADAIGDMVVVLTNLAHLAGLRIEDCINGAYQEIKNRKGKMIDGTFVKDV